MTHADFNDLETRDYVFKIGDRGKAIQARYDENTDALIFPRAPFDYVCKLLNEALSQEPCDDAISRILKRMWNCRGKHTTSIDKVAMEQIIRDELPPVTQKSGKWEFHCQHWSKCSICGYADKFADKWNYCPNCGAKMENVEKSLLDIKREKAE